MWLYVLHLPGTSSRGLLPAKVEGPEGLPPPAACKNEHISVRCWDLDGPNVWVAAALLKWDAPQQRQPSQ